jgi:hypothetical protein
MTSDRVLHLRVPWWAHPAWALVLLTGVSAFAAVRLSASAYWTFWQTRKYLDDNLTEVLALTVTAAVAGLVLAAWPTARARTATVRLTVAQVVYLRAAYRALFGLALVGYGLWVGIGVANGVGWADLEAVLGRSNGAISQLKRMIRPVAGLTTLTQFGPLAVAVGVLLGRLGSAGRGYRVLFVLAGVRTVFYAERLALIEVLVPALIIAAMTVGPDKRASSRVAMQAAPLVAGPAVWLLFAVSEYGRNWIYHQRTATMPFWEWVSIRFVGYYTTTFNNSALFAQRFPTFAVDPYFTVEFFWNAPLVEAVVQPGLVAGMRPGPWWAYTRTHLGNPEFTNVGSFLMTFGELGLPLALLYWAVLGVVFGRLYNGLRRGRVWPLLAYASLFVTILELPRFIYVAQGRSTPVIAALVVMALTWPRTRAVWQGVGPGGRVPGLVWRGRGA